MLRRVFYALNIISKHRDDVSYITHCYLLNFINKICSIFKIEGEFWGGWELLMRFKIGREQFLY